MVGMRKALTSRDAELASGQLIVTDEFDGLCFKCCTNLWITQGPQLCFALGGIGAEKVWIHVAWMTAQFGDVRAELGFENSDESFRRDLLRMCLTAPLPVKV